MLFKRIRGVHAIKKKLCSMVQRDRVPPAQLFIGMEGGVAMPLVLATINYIHCLQRSTEDSCGHCSSCLKMHALVHPDFCSLFPIGTTEKIKAKEVNTTAFFSFWQSFLKEHPYGTLQDWLHHLNDEPRNAQITKEQIHYMRSLVSEKPFVSNYKTVLVWLPEYMNASAGNAILKMIEEPIPNTFFFFVTSNVHNILSTLRSRTYALYVPPLDDEVMYQTLCTLYPQKGQDQIQEVVNIVQGNLSFAKKILSEGHENYFEHFVEWMRQAYSGRFDALIKLSDAFCAYSVQGRKNWASYVLHLLRGALLLPFGANFVKSLTDFEITFCKKFSNVVSQTIIGNIVAKISRLARILQQNANAKLAFVHVSLDVAAEFRRKG